MALITNKWIWQHPDWPSFSYQDQQVLPLLRAVRLKQGILLGKAGGGSVYPTSTREALDVLLQNIITSSAIEGESLNVSAVRSSLAKRLGLAQERPYPTTSRSEGLAEVMLDAIDNHGEELSLSRLFQWHGYLFPEEEFLLQPVLAGQFRGDEPMQVVSGRIDRPTVHFEAPPRQQLSTDMGDFIRWFNQSRDDVTLDPLLRAALAHFWLITLHPFDDGNGRITRAVTDLALAQANSPSIHLYAMSAAILVRRKAYYAILEKCQRGVMDITAWLVWFLQTLDAALQQSLDDIDRTLGKSRFWRHYHDAGLSAPQIKVLNRLLEGGDNDFELGISAAQYQKVAKVSKPTATRHLSDLVSKDCIEKLAAGGRSTRYKIKPK